MAQKAMPLVGDPEPVEVIYEDDDIIAVNKPPNVISAPKHRYKVQATSLKDAASLLANPGAEYSLDTSCAEHHSPDVCDAVVLHGHDVSASNGSTASRPLNMIHICDAYDGCCNTCLSVGREHGQQTHHISWWVIAPSSECSTLS